MDIALTAASGYIQWRAIMTRTAALLAFLLLLTAPPAWSDRIQSQASIIKAATDFLRQQIGKLEGQAPEIVPGRLDSRLRLARCDLPLEAFMPPGRRELGNTTVGVRCSGSKRWTLYVPMTINVYTGVVVAATSLPKGEQLDSSKIKIARHNLARLPQGYFRDPSAVEGMMLKRNVTACRPLTPAMLKAKRLIERGQRVTMLATGGGLEVRMPGEALSHGSSGERIRVRNISSRKVVEGVVVAAGTVRVDM
jgi:flagella basal body P-ring formation protein FlgA